MTTITTGNVASSLPALLNLVRRGESVLLLEDGRPVAQLTPPPAEPDDNPWWRGTYEVAVPAPAAGVPLPNATAPERLLPEINADWYRSDDDA